ncbi:glycoprotein [Wenling frogfish arenavirus 1]|uniref:Glycoprotein n=1 Tax=Wenling frogfish arenavirus 1 TaxID=2116466 RepID=A0A2P1GNW3_9VIRU|nr:glycoprotein [Wenling frogfish arenavirus 1]AVM87644.1 glycoprotein [Wenling frogfish arenavirus 1]
MLLDFITHPILLILRSVLTAASGVLLMLLFGLLVWRSKGLPWLFLFLSLLGMSDCTLVTHISEVEQKLFDGSWLCGSMHVFKSEASGMFSIRHDGNIPQELTRGCNVTSADGMVSLECSERPKLFDMTSLVSLRCPKTGCVSGLSCELIHDCEKTNLTVSPELAPQFCGTSLDAYLIDGVWRGDSLRMCENETLLSIAAKYKRPFSAGTEKLTSGYIWRGVERDNCFCYELNERSFPKIASSAPSIFYKAMPVEGADCHHSSVFTIHKGKPLCIKNGDDLMTRLMVVGAVNLGEMDLCIGKYGIIAKLKESSVKELAFRVQVSDREPGSVTAKGKPTQIDFCSQFQHDGQGCVATSCGCIHPLKDRSRFGASTATVEGGAKSRRRSRREAECYFWGFYCTSDDVLFATSEEEKAFLRVSEQVDQNTADIALIKGKLDFMAKVMQAGFCSNGSRHFQGSVEVQIIEGVVFNVSDWCTEETFKEFCETQSVSEHNLSSQVRQSIMNARNNEKQSVFTTCLLLLALDLAIFCLLRKLWKIGDFEIKHSHIGIGLSGETICMGYHRFREEEYICRCGRISLGSMMSDVNERCNYRGESPAVDNNRVKIEDTDGTMNVIYMCKTILTIGRFDTFSDKESEIIQALTKTDNDPDLLKMLILMYPNESLLTALLGPQLDEIQEEEELIYEEVGLVALQTIPKKPPRRLNHMAQTQRCCSTYNLYSPTYPEAAAET